MTEPTWFGAFCAADDDEIAQMGDPSPKSDYDPIPIEHEAAYVDLWMQLCRVRDQEAFEKAFR